MNSKKLNDIDLNFLCEILGIYSFINANASAEMHIISDYVLGRLLNANENIILVQYFIKAIITDNINFVKQITNFSQI